MTLTEEEPDSSAPTTRLGSPAGSSLDRAAALRRDLKCSVADGVSFSVMVGLAETYLPMFVLALGMGEVTSGLIASAPMLAGGVLQLAAPWGVYFFGSRRRWVVTCAFIQSLCYLPLALAAWAGSIPKAALFLIVSVYWAASLSTGPAWNTWIEKLVPSRIRPGFFACRSRLCQLGVFTGLCTAGLLLQWMSGSPYVTTAFAGLFVAAGICRGISTWMLAAQSEPASCRTIRRPVHARVILNRLTTGPAAQLLQYLLAIQFTVFIAGPFFNGYIFVQLGLEYYQYLMLTGVSFFAKMMSYPVMARLARQYGVRRVFTWCGLAVVPMPIGWLISDRIEVLLILQIFAGASWAGYELCMFLLLFDELSHDERLEVMTGYNLVHTVATAAGAFVGASLLTGFGENPTGYAVVFLASTVGRGLSHLLLRRRTPAEAVIEKPTAAPAIAAPTPAPTVVSYYTEDANPVNGPKVLVNPRSVKEPERAPIRLLK